jgi:hypothetical protein
MKHVSYSQYNIFKACPYQWKLIYVDGHKIPSASIHLIFGSALHKVIQQYLDTFYKQTGKEADEMDLNTMLLTYMLEELESYKKHGLEGVTNPGELKEYYTDGVKILNWFKKHRGDYFSKKGYELLGYELPLNVKLPNGANFTARLDMVIKDKQLKKIKIIDFKKSYRGWNDNAKKDPIKRGQLQLYKAFWSQINNVSPENIKIEFMILKQKVNEESEYPGARRRVQRFEPPSSEITLKKIKKDFIEFANTIIKNGEFDLTQEYKATPSNENCKWCPFKTRKDICAYGI